MLKRITLITLALVSCQSAFAARSKSYTTSGPAIVDVDGNGTRHTYQHYTDGSTCHTIETHYAPITTCSGGRR